MAITTSKDKTSERTAVSTQKTKAATDTAGATPQEITELFTTGGGTDVGGGATLNTGTTATTQGKKSTANDNKVTSSANIDPLVNSIVIMAERLSDPKTSETDRNRYTRGIDVLAELIGKKALQGTTENGAVTPVKKPTDVTVTKPVATTPEKPSVLAPVTGEDANSVLVNRLVNAMVAIVDVMATTTDTARLDRYSTGLETLAMVVDKNS